MPAFANTFPLAARLIGRAKKSKLKNMLGWLMRIFSSKTEASNDQTTVTLSKKDEITTLVDREDGFKDMGLRIAQVQRTAKSHIFEAVGVYNGVPVGLKIELENNITNGIDETGEMLNTAFVRNGVRFSSIGIQSNSFLTALAQEYEVKTNGEFSRNAVAATVFSLNQVVARLDVSGDYKFKLFFNDDGHESQYGEMYMNINTDSEIIELMEKDPGYRTQILAALSE